MVTRLEIARARARLALAQRSGEVLPDEVLARARMDFSEAPRIPRAWDPQVASPGAHADGRDFGVPTVPFSTLSTEQAAWEQAAVIESTVSAPETCVAQALDERRPFNWQRAINASLTEPEVARHIGEGRLKLRWMLSVGDLFAFVTNRELRYPTWQFTDDPLRPVLPHLSELVDAIPAELSPASIDDLMRTPHRSIRIEGRAVTPIEWLKARRNVQRIVEIFDAIAAQARSGRRW